MPQTGTAWVPVYPDTRRVDPETRRAFSRLGPYAVEVTPQVKDVAAVRRAMATLPHIVLPVDVDDRELMDLRARLQALGNHTIGVDISAGQVREELASIGAQADRLSGRTARLDVAVDAGAASAALQTADREVSRLDGRTASLRVVADIAQVVTAVGTVIALVNQLDGRTASINVVADTARAVAGMAMVATRASMLGGAVGGVAALGSVVLGLGPAGAIAAGGLGAAVLASGGVGKALTALGAAQDAAGTDAQASAQKQAQAARQVESAQLQATRSAQAAGRARSDAAQSVTRAEQQSAAQITQAQKSAAASITAADKQAETAHRTLATATRDLEREQRTLTTAWTAGSRALQDLQDQVDGNALDQRQAAYDLEDARKALDEARRGGDAGQIGRAQLAYDKQLETIDRLNKQTQRLGTDNAAAQAKGVAGTDQYQSALDRVSQAAQRQQDAIRGVREADAASSQARIDGAASVSAAEEAGRQRVADAVEQGRRQVEAADQAAGDAQRALQDALVATASEASSTQQALQTAFANLSPAAASFAMYLWSLKGLFDQLRTTAAAGFFPPIQAGLAALVGQFSIFQTVVGQFASAMGAALGYVLTQLASPFWTSFFSALGVVAGPILMQLFVVLMQVAQAGAGLVLALLPFAPMALNMLGIVAQLLSVWTPFIALLVGQMLPVAGQLLIALMPLGAVLGALAPILAVLGQMFAMVLGALLQALVPVIIALTPLIQQLALAWGQQLVGAIVGLTPLLVGIATFMSQHPQLVLGVISVLGGLFVGWQAITAVVSALLSPLVLLKLVMMATGLAATAIGGSIGGLLATVSRSFGVWSLFKALLGFVSGALSGLANGIGGLLGMVLRSLGPLGWVALILSTLYLQSDAFRGAVNNLLGVLMGLVGVVLSSLTPVLDVVVQVMTLLGQVFAGVAGGLATALVPVVQALADLLAWLTPVIVPLVQVFLAVRAAMMLWAAAQWALNIAMAANPIGLVVLAVAALVGGLVWAWQSSETFRNIVTGAWTAITTAVSWAWNTIIWPVLSALGTAFDFLGRLIFAVLVFPFVLAWQLISSAVSAAWTSILQPIWYGAIVPGLQFLGAVMTWLYTNVVLPIWDAIGAAISFVWNSIILPIWSAITWYINNVTIPVMQFLYNNVILPIWNAIGAAISWVWNTLILPVWTAITWYINNVTIPVMQFLYYNIIKPIWDAIGAAISFVWTNVISPAFQAVAAGLGWLGDRFKEGTDRIGQIWNTIRGFLAKPINFMIDVVWNRGVVPAWNAVAGLVGLGPIQPLGMIPEAATGGRVDSAGMIHGPGTGTSDSILAQVGETDQLLKVSRDEFIVNAAATRRNYPALVAMNGGAEIGGPRSPGVDVRGLAGGGPVWPGLWNTVHAQFPNARMTDNYRPGASDYHGKGMAIDVAGSYPMAVGQMKEINQWIGRTFPGSTELIHYPLFGGGINIKNGGPHLYNPATQFAHQNHVHWAQDPAGPQGGGNGGSIGSIISTFFKDKARAAFDGITNPAIDMVRRLVGDPPPAWRGAVTGLATKARDTVRDFVFRKADEKDAAASSGAGGAAMGPPTAGQIAHAREIAAAARERGIGHEGFVIALMTGLQESGLRILANPKVPGSMSMFHEGIGGDHDSVGIFQQRQAGWGTLPMRMNARASAGMFLNKLGRGPYGDYGAAAQRVQVSAFPGAYSKWRGKAEEISRAVPYDSGGWALGKGVMLKDVIQPEKMLDPVESEAGYRPLVKLSAQLSQGQVPVASAETAAARAAALVAPRDPAPATGGPLVAHLYDTDGVLLGTIRGEVDSGLAAVAADYRDGSS